MKRLKIRINVFDWELIPLKKMVTSRTTEYYFLMFIFLVQKTEKQYSKHRDNHITFKLTHPHGGKTWEAKLTDSEVTKIAEILESTK